ncbi:MAG: glycosyltransferase [Candidatus Alcyoniella australis]|nr:glycosyltransferase [Candidatus Alcyoniella australis]
MRLLVVGHTYITRANHGVLRAMAKLDCEITVATPGRWPDPLFTLEHEPAQPPLRSIALPTVGSGREGWYLLRGLGRALSKQSFDAVRVDHGPGALACWQTLRLARRLWPSAAFAFFTWWNVPWSLRPPQSWAQRAVLRRSDGAICGNAEAQRLLQGCGFAKPTTVLPQLGVDSALFKPGDKAQARARNDLSQGAPLIGFIGRLVREKGVFDLLEALARMPGETRLLLVGRGDESGIAARARELGVGQRLIVRPSVPHERIAGLLPALDVLALPSQPASGWQEQFGHVLIEAMACGVPVVGSQSGEIPNVIGEAGLIVPYSAPTELAAALQRVLDEPLLASRLAASGHERVEQRFCDRAVARANLEFLAGLIADRGRAA